MVVAEERPRIALASSFARLFSGLNLSPRAVSTSFGCRVNVAMCLQVGGEKIELIIHFFSHKDETFFVLRRWLQGASSPDPTTVYVDLRALRNDRVSLPPHKIDKFLV